MTFPLHFAVLAAGLWALVNGILHDVFVLRQKRPYDRELIRLLMDGHVLIFSGVIYLVSVPGVRSGETLALWNCIVAAVFMVIYCLLIFKILPSVVTLLINVAVLILAITRLGTG